MTIQEQQRAAREFAQRWNGRGYEKGEGQIFWIDLLGNVFGVEQPTEFITFETQVKLDHTSFIDGFIETTKVMIEQKSLGKNLRAGIVQSDGSLLSPFQQAKRYAAELPYSKRPRWIVTCNFAEFLVYDMEQPNGEPYHIALADLEKEYYRLQFLVDTGKEHLQRELEVSKKAGEIIGVIYDKLLERYTTSPNPSQGGGFYAAEGVNSKDTPSLGGGRGEVLHSLNMLCVRLVFCLYAEDAGVFNSKQQFGDYLKQFAPKDIRNALLNLFKVLDTPIAERERFLESELAAFPYVNGGLFSVEDRNIPQFTEELKDLLCRKASDDFDWSEISPTIFGAIFESTLNPETRRSGGMHYTSIENIHKVIDPLFLNELEAEFEAIQGEAVSNRLPQKAIINRFSLLHEKIASLTFLDPACGSGNFLTETYMSLRRLENKIISALNKGQSVIGFNADYSPIKVGIHQFYGIEINDFAVTVARTALWIAEHQMLRETQAIVAHDLDFLPLKSYNNIVEGNALTIKWEDLPLTPSQGGGIPNNVNDAELPSLGGAGGGRTFDYIMGNPPFVGHQYRSREQAADMDLVFSDFENYGKLDFVAAWYKKAADYMQGEAISNRLQGEAACAVSNRLQAIENRFSLTRCAFVSTNSICQGESVAVMWKPLFEKKNLQIIFAYPTFKWESEATDMAAVHCVVIGFVCGDYHGDKWLYDNAGNKKAATNINGYLCDAPNMFIENRGQVLTAGLPKMSKGSQPTDGGNLLLSAEEKDYLIAHNPLAAKWVRRYMGAEEYINNKERYCLWLVGADPAELRRCPLVMERVQAVREMRLKSPTKSVQRDADTPTLFTQRRQPTTPYLLIPRVSSENRRYVPIGFMSPDIIVSDAAQYIANADLYMFGVLMSNVHNAWMRAVCGRLKSDYRYSPAVYNNFPWCNPTEAQRAKIEKTAQGILDARALYPNANLADLYDEAAMPIELRRAHQANDRAVMEAYGFTVGTSFTEQDCVSKLMERYKGMMR